MPPVSNDIIPSVPSANIAANTHGSKDRAVKVKVRPGHLPPPEFFCDLTQYEGHISTDYWVREDAIFLHPPIREAVCAVLRNVQLGVIAELSAAVHTPRDEGPTIGFSMGVTNPGHVTGDDWQRYMGPTALVLPGSWGIVEAAIATDLSGPCCDVLLSTRVIGAFGNANAWGLFRRFAFQLRNPSP